MIEPDSVTKPRDDNSQSISPRIVVQALSQLRESRKRLHPTDELRRSDLQVSGQGRAAVCRDIPTATPDSVMFARAES